MKEVKIEKTPLWEFGKNTGWNTILLKDETKQLTSAFKIRGVLNKFKTTNLDQYDTIITASTGNHGQAVALCSNYFDKKCIIVVPETTPKCKIEKISKYNPIIISENLENYDKCKEEAIKIAKENNYLYIPSFDDYDIIEGHKSLFNEIDWNDIDYCFCPIGGGGLISACIENLKNTQVEVIGVEIEKMDAMNKSLLAGNIQQVDINAQKESFAEGILVSEVGEKNFEIAQKSNLKICTVSEDEIKDAIQKLYNYNNIKAEGAGAAALACALKHQKQDKKCVCIISGGNIDDEIFKKIIEVKG